MIGDPETNSPFRDQSNSGRCLYPPPPHRLLPCVPAISFNKNNNNNKINNDKKCFALLTLESCGSDLRFYGTAVQESGNGLVTGTSVAPF